MIPLNSLKQIHKACFTTEFNTMYSENCKIHFDFQKWSHYINSCSWNLNHEFRSDIMNSYTWICVLRNSMKSNSIHMNSYTHEFIWSFHIWIHIAYVALWVHMIISHMNLYVFEFTSQTCDFICKFSYKLWIDMIFSYLNSFVSWIHRWIRGTEVSEAQTGRLGIQNSIPVSAATAAGQTQTKRHSNWSGMASK